MNTHEAKFEILSDAELDAVAGGKDGCVKYYSDGPNGAGVYACGPTLGELVNNFFAGAGLPGPFK